MPENVNTSALTNDAFNLATDNRDTMVKVDHVSMVFNMASEQLNSLKEYAIKIIRRELFFEGFTALDDVSFEVKKGDVFGIIGTNGSGKSTMLKIIAGVLEPTKGTCEINGNIAPLIELGAGFDTELSARENIFLNGALLGYSREFIKEHFDDIVEFAEIEKFLDMPLKNYSSGMVARIAFAIATVIVPEILVVDEVLSVGDFMFQKKCEDRISELIEKNGVTVLIVSHSNEQVERLCNKVIWIEKGHTRMIGDAASVCRVYGGLGGRTGNPDSEKKVFEALSKSGKSDISEMQITKIRGENADGTNVRLALRAWQGENIETVVLACASTHINAIIANPLAGALNAPILSTKPEDLSESVERLLYQFRPKEIITVDCGGNASNTFSQFKNLPWHPHVVTFSNNGNIWDMCIDIFSYGLERSYWSNEVALLDFYHNPESLVASPYLYAAKSPVFITHQNETPDLDVFINLLKDTQINSLVMFGESSIPAISSKANEQDIQVSSINKETTHQTCLAISTWVSKNLAIYSKGRTELCVASLSLAQWPELLACGCYTAKRAAAFILEDTTNLDSISDCLEFVHSTSNSLHAIVSIGEQLGLGDTELRMLHEEINPSKLTSTR